MLLHFFQMEAGVLCAVYKGFPERYTAINISSELSEITAFFNIKDE